MNRAQSEPSRSVRDVGRGKEADAAVRRCVQAALTQGERGAPTIIGLEREPVSSRSSYRTELVTLHLDNGRPLQIFLKDFGSCKHLKEGSLGAGDMVDRRWREVSVYRELLTTADLGTARYHGTVWDDSRQWFWLLLEYVEGRKLKAFGFEHWLEAARWLGRMQARFAGANVSQLDFLIEHDGTFFTSVADEAIRAAWAASARLAAGLSTALSGYDELVAAMGADRSTFVHGAFRPYNIVVSPQAGHRLCVVDWEESARGSPLYDLACVADGFERQPPRLEALIDGYEEEAAAAGRALPDREGVHRLIYGVCMHRNLNTLAKAHTRSFSLEGISKLVARIEELARRVW